MTVPVDTVLGTDDFERANEIPISTPYLSWLSVKPDLNSGTIVIGSGDSDGFVTRPETVGPDCYFLQEFNDPWGDDLASTVFVGARLTAHSDSADGYTAILEHGTGGLRVTLYKGAALTPFATSTAQDYAGVQGICIKCVGFTISALVKIGGVWEEAVSAVDTTYPDAGYVGFGLQTIFGSPPGIKSIEWGTSIIPIPAGERLYGRLEPLAYDDANQDYALRNLAVALMAPREVFEIARADATHEHPWGRLLDPDACPDELLDWLAVFAGVEFPPSTLTATEKRYRILQAAGRYRGTPRAVIEELQLVLTDSKTVYLGYHTPDEWHYTVGTIDSETPDADAVERAVLAQKPVGMLVDVVSTSDWSYLVLAPFLVGYQDGNGYAVAAPTYPDYASLVTAFSDYQHLEDNDPDL